MKQTKYITSGGLAFAEEKDMKKLRRFSLKGWHVSHFTFMGYTLEKGESSDFIYSIDYRSLNEDEKAEYFDFFSSAGWSHVVSEGNIHLFRAYPHTKPIYSDSETKAEKHKISGDSMKNVAISLVLITALVWVGAIISSGILQTILLAAAVIFSGLACPAAWTVLTTYSNKWKIEGRKKMVNLVKYMPAFLLSIAVIILFIVGGANITIIILTSMIIGAVALPTAIWLFMTLYHQIKRVNN